MYSTMIRLSIGFISLTTGRQLHWLFAGGVTFLSTFFLVPTLFGIYPDTNLFLTSLIAGIIVGVLASMLGRIVTTISLFLAGAYLLVTLPEILGWTTTWTNWTSIAVAGLVAVLLALIWYDFTLILLSSLTGAGLIVQTLNLNPFNTLIAYLGTTIFGMATQIVLMQYWPVLEEE
jgi:hypothetical protein